MLNLFKNSMLGLVVGLAAAAAIGCGGEDSNQSPGVVSKIVDSVAVAISEGFGESEVVMATATEDETKPAIEEGSFGPIGRMIRTTDKLYAASPNGLIIYDFGSREYSLAPSTSEVRAVVEHAGNIYAGGADLYRLADGVLEKQPEQFEGVINTLQSYEHRLMIGTTTGLYSTSIFGKELLFEDVSVTAMVSGGGGLWVGTDGQGLYRWDGRDFQKRFLRRDSSLFDYIAALDFSHNHLYAASPNGLHVFNGGTWTTYVTSDGIPDANINDIDASGWMVYIGTDAGVVSLYDDQIAPVEGLEQQAVNGVVRKGNKLIYSTDADGIFRRSGKHQTQLVPPKELDQGELLLTAG